jgi:hypothetical protein
MKTITNITICNCENQHLLSPGCTCDICMGNVMERNPYRSVANDLRYGPDYFEALEQMQMESDGFGPDLAA